VAHVVDSANDGPCLRGVSDDGDGTFLLGHVSGSTLGPPITSYEFFRIDGDSATRVGSHTGAGDESGIQVFSQPSGFSTFVVQGFDGSSVLGSYSHTGDLVLGIQLASGDPSHIPSSAVGVDPSGGTAAVKTFFTGAKGWVTTYQRFDKQGVAETGEVQIDTGEHRVGGVGVALSGHALILTSVGNPSWEARWVARDGSLISGPFTLQGPAGPKFQFLADGSLAVGFAGDFSAPGTNFVYRIEDGATSAGPLPDWLAASACAALAIAGLRWGHAGLQESYQLGVACAARLQRAPAVHVFLVNHRYPEIRREE